MRNYKKYERINYIIYAVLVYTVNILLVLVVASHKEAFYGIKRWHKIIFTIFKNIEICSKTRISIFKGIQSP